MNRTPIEWTDFTANPLKYRTADGHVVWACEKVSAGCANCYADALSHRYGGVRRAGDWNAATMAGLTPFLDEAELRRMLTLKAAAGKRCFVGDMTDLFGEWVPDALLDRLFAVFALRPNVTWQVLTKRPDRARAYFAGEGVLSRIADQAADIFRTRSLGRTDLFKIYPVGPGGEFGARWFVHPFPLPNVWLGVSAENQAAADERIPHLLQTPAAVRFVSAEPLLGDINIAKYLDTTTDVPCCGEDGCEYCDGTGTAQRSDLNWVIVGGESGRKSRHCRAGWIRSVVEQCVAAGTAVFVKQVGSCVVDRNDRLASDNPAPNPDDWPEPACGWDDGSQGNLIRLDDGYQGAPVQILLKDRKGGDLLEWPLALRVRQFPDVTA